jgi:hypothetical protein
MYSLKPPPLTAARRLSALATAFDCLRFEPTVVLRASEGYDEACEEGGAEAFQTFEEVRAAHEAFLSLRFGVEQSLREARVLTSETTLEETMTLFYRVNDHMQPNRDTLTDVRGNEALLFIAEVSSIYLSHDTS